MPVGLTTDCGSEDSCEAPDAARASARKTSKRARRVRTCPRSHHHIWATSIASMPAAQVKWQRLITRARAHTHTHTYTPCVCQGLACLTRDRAHCLCVVQPHRLDRASARPLLPGRRGQPDAGRGVCVVCLKLATAMPVPRAHRCTCDTPCTSSSLSRGISVLY